MENRVPGYIIDQRIRREEGYLAVEGKTDAERSELLHLHRDWNAETMYEVDNVVRSGDKLYKRIQPMTYLEGIPPEDAPALWSQIMYRDGIRIIPDVIEAAQAFALDELGWWGDALYKSLINGNVWTPEQYSAGWEEVTHED